MVQVAFTTPSSATSMAAGTSASSNQTVTVTVSSRMSFTARLPFSVQLLDKYPSVSVSSATGAALMGKMPQSVRSPVESITLP